MRSLWSARSVRKEGTGEAVAEEIRPVVNVIVRELAPLEQFLSDGVEDALGPAQGARVHRLPGAERVGEEEQPDGLAVGSSIRAAAPPMQSFGMGRRR